jgi:hypothetical protein
MEELGGWKGGLRGGLVATVGVAVAVHALSVVFFNTDLDDLRNAGLALGVGVVATALEVIRSGNTGRSRKDS